MDTSTEIAIAAAAGIAIFGYFWLSNDPSDNPDMHIGPNMPCKQVLKKLQQFKDEGILDKVYDTFTPGDVKSWEEALARCEAQSNNSKIAEYMKKVVQYETCVAELPELLHEIDTGSSYSAALAKYDSSCGDLAKDAIAAHIKKREGRDACTKRMKQYVEQQLRNIEKGSTSAIQMEKAAWYAYVRAHSDACHELEKEAEQEIAKRSNSQPHSPCQKELAPIVKEAEAKLATIKTYTPTNYPSSLQYTDPWLDAKQWICDQISTATTSYQCTSSDPSIQRLKDIWEEIDSAFQDYQQDLGPNPRRPQKFHCK